MRNLNLDQLQTLIAIADLGTFAAAAQALHLAPPTVSLHIKELESRLEAALVVRGRRQAELTPAGEVLVQEGTISTEDLKLFHYVDTPQAAWQTICDFYQLSASPAAA